MKRLWYPLCALAVSCVSSPGTIGYAKRTGDWYDAISRIENPTERYSWYQYAAKHFRPEPPSAVALVQKGSDIIPLIARDLRNGDSETAQIAFYAIAEIHDHDRGLICGRSEIRSFFSTARETKKGSPEYPIVLQVTESCGW